jgi:hypothetical protein
MTFAPKGLCLVHALLFPGNKIEKNDELMLNTYVKLGNR